MDAAIIRNKFISLFGNTPILISAPGRINLIGEHTDYNDGFVLPAAINKKVIFALSLNSLRKFRFYASDLDQHYETKNVQPAPYKFQWANYLLGVLAQFEKEGVKLVGVDCVFASNIPIGAGLSSSAAIECGFAYGFNKLVNAGFSDYQLVQMAQKAEHEYAGVMCGIMDQYASMFGKKDHVLRLDCKAIEHEYFPFKMNNLVIALCDTQVKHELASSAYNERRKECEGGVSILQKFDPSIKTLRDVKEAFLQKHISSFDLITFRRCHYVIKENERVIKACNALKESNFNAFGKLMYQSHEGLQYEYEVSCNELDLLVDLTRDMDFVLGARMMGGGFGGCTINLLEKDKKSQFQQLMEKEYQAKTGKMPEFYFVELSNGVSIVK